MGFHDEILAEKRRRAWPPGQDRAKCSVRSCHSPEKERGLCFRHLGNPVARNLRQQVRKEGVDLLRKQR